MASAKAYIAFFLILLVAAGVVLALGSIPAAAFGGSSTPICNTTLIVEGTYNDNGLSHWVSGFVFQYGATQCAAPSALDLLGVPEYQQLVIPQENIFPLSFTFTIQVVDQLGSNARALHDYCQRASRAVRLLLFSSNDNQRSARGIISSIHRQARLHSLNTALTVAIQYLSKFALLQWISG